jgi:hypothetical protein
VIVRRILPVFVFLSVFVAHALYSGFWARAAPAGWADLDVSSSAVGPLGLLAYWRGQDYFVSFSYALAAAFAAWALSRCISSRGREGTAGAAAGSITLVGVLMASGCFLIGCCGSPMLAVYLSLFGAKVLGLAKPLTALITVISVGCGYWCLSRRFARGECVDACCSPTETPSKAVRTSRPEAGATTHKTEPKPRSKNRFAASPRNE